jgi:hypothetical protein
MTTTPKEDFWTGAWGWWASRDEEYYTIGPAETRGEIIAEACHDQGFEEEAEDGGWQHRFYICEARQNPIRMSRYLPDIDWLLETITDDWFNSDECGEGDDSRDHFVTTLEQRVDLEKEIRKVFDDWQMRHNLRWVPWQFSDSRSQEHVVVPIRGKETDND